MKKQRRGQAEYAVVRAVGRMYHAYFRGHYHGAFLTSGDAWEALWNGPIGADLVAVQRDLSIKRAAHRAAEKRRKELELEAESVRAVNEIPF